MTLFAQGPSTFTDGASLVGSTVHEEHIYRVGDCAARLLSAVVVRILARPVTTDLKL